MHGERSLQGEQDRMHLLIWTHKCLGHPPKAQDKMLHDILGTVAWRRQGHVEPDGALQVVRAESSLAADDAQEGEVALEQRRIGAPKQDLPSRGRRGVGV